MGFVIWIIVAVYAVIVISTAMEVLSQYTYRSDVDKAPSFSEGFCLIIDIIDEMCIESYLWGNYIWKAILTIFKSIVAIPILLIYSILKICVIIFVAAFKRRKS